jgi:hypothetical protein
MPRRARSSPRSESQSRTPVKCISDVDKGLGQGWQVPVIYTPGIQGGGELGQRRWPFRALGDCGDGHFLNDSDEPVDLDDPVDDLDGGAPGCGGTGGFPGPVST